MTKQYELLPCPFCGGEGILIRHLLMNAPSYRYYTIGCGGECQIEIGEFPSEEEAAKAWNRRQEGAK